MYTTFCYEHKELNLYLDLREEKKIYFRLFALLLKGS